MSISLRGLDVIVVIFICYIKYYYISCFGDRVAFIIVCWALKYGDFGVLFVGFGLGINIYVNIKCVYVCALSRRGV